MPDPTSEQQAQNQDAYGENRKYNDYNNMKEVFDAWFANVKRTYDEFQQESLETIRHNRTHFDKIMSDAQQYDNARQVIANRALELAVTRDNQNIQNHMESSNMTAKQYMRQVDLLMYGDIPPIDAIMANIANMQTSLDQILANMVTANKTPSSGS